MSCCQTILVPPTSPALCPCCLCGNELPALSQGNLYWSGTQWEFRTPGATAYVFITKTGSTVNPPVGDFNGVNVYICTLTNSNVNSTLPNPASVTPGLTLRYSMIGGSTLTIKPYGTELLDGQSTTLGWVITQPDYQVGGFIPAQSFGLTSDGTNWHSIVNY